ncbi:hypothetical protein, partial [Microbacterium plantarum]
NSVLSRWTSLSLFDVFNEFNDKDNLALFMFREFEKEQKENSTSSFLLICLSSPKKHKTIQAITY